jgi:hypothetical protein
MEKFKVNSTTPIIVNIIVKLTYAYTSLIRTINIMTI